MEPVAVGIGVRDAYVEPLMSLADRRAVDVLEVMIDEGLEEAPRRAAWRRLGAKWPLVAHGTELGIGAAAGLDARYVERVGAALAATHVRWYSEHLAFLGAGGVELGHFAPVSNDPESLGALRANARAVRAAIGCPLLLENPADVLGWGAERGGHALGEDFAASLGAADAGALLDLTNLALGAKNDGYDAVDFLDALPMERVVEIHLAGGRFDGALWIDSHDHDVGDDELELLARIAPRAPNLRAVIVERDDRLPSFERMLAEVDRVRRVLEKEGRA